LLSCAPKESPTRPSRPNKRIFFLYSDENLEYCRNRRNYFFYFFKIMIFVRIFEK